MSNVFLNKFANNRFLSDQRGASLLEGIAYLGIAALVILGAVSLLSGAFSSATTNRAAEEIIAIRTAVKKLYMGQNVGYGTGALATDLNNAKALPTTLAVTSSSGVTTFKNAWDGAVVITGAGNTFTISYESIPKDVCINLLSTSTGWNSVKVGNNTLSTPISPTTASNNCDDSNTIV